jgi:hypothetical protein
MRFDLMSSCEVETEWSIVTAGYRVVRRGDARVSGRTTVVWDLRDDQGALVANGLYWFVARAEDGEVVRTPVLRLR